MIPVAGRPGPFLRHPPLHSRSNYRAVHAVITDDSPHLPHTGLRECFEVVIESQEIDKIW